MFLSLSGLLIFALLGTLVETARYTVCRNHTARTLRMAAQGLLTEYNRPLYEHYGLFFIESEGTPYQQVIADYMGDTLEASQKGNKDFLAGHLTDLQIMEKTYIGDYEAAPLQEEIVEYRKRVATKDSIDKLLKKKTELQGIDQETERLEQEVKRQKEEAKQDQQVLELMKLVDGISVKNGRIHCRENFAKCFAVKEVKGQNYSVSEVSVWKKMKSKIDVTPQTWNFHDKAKFLAKLRKVKEITGRAIQKGSELKKSYSLAGLASLRTNYDILQQTEQLLTTRDIEQCREELEMLWKDYDTVSLRFDYTGIKERGGGKDPRDSFQTAWKSGISNLVCKESDRQQDKTMAEPDFFVKYYKEQPDNLSEKDQITDFIENESLELKEIVGNLKKNASEEFCLNEYISRKLGNYTHPLSGWKHILDYEGEYVVAGKRSDTENLEYILKRIMLMRTVINFGAIMRDRVRVSEAQAAALAVVGFSGMQPLITFVKTLILITWSMVESLVDVAGLLQKKQVPLMKSPSQLRMRFDQLFRINRKTILEHAAQLPDQKASSFGYREYLLLFLASTKKSTRLYRVMDLIQANMRLNGYKDFQLSTCVYDIRVKGTIQYDAQFFHFSMVEKLLGRNLNDYFITKEITAGY